MTTAQDDKPEASQAAPAVGIRLDRSVGRPAPKRLAADVARCPGYETDEGGLREGCEDCRRRTDRSAFDERIWMMAPPLIVVFECEARIEP